MNIRKQRKKARKRVQHWFESGFKLEDPTGHQFDLCDQWDQRKRVRY